MKATLRTVVPVWVFATLGGLVSLYAVEPGFFVDSVALVMVGVIFLAFCLELALAHKEGMVTRLMLGVSGGVILLSVATAIWAILTGLGN